MGDLIEFVSGMLPIVCVTVMIIWWTKFRSQVVHVCIGGGQTSVIEAQRPTRILRYTVDYESRLTRVTFYVTRGGRASQAVYFVIDDVGMIVSKNMIVPKALHAGQYVLRYEEASMSYVLLENTVPLPTLALKPE